MPFWPAGNTPPQPKPTRPRDMERDNEKPAPVATGSGPSKSVQRGSKRLECKGKLELRLGPDGDPMTVAGRDAETFRRLIRTGARGFRSGEASRFGWARRTAHYVFRLRRKGLDVATLRERAGDARIGRYVLQSPVVLLRGGEGRPCV